MAFREFVIGTRSESSPTGHALVIRHPDSVVLPVWIRPSVACPPMPLVAQVWRGSIATDLVLSLRPARRTQVTGEPRSGRDRRMRCLGAPLWPGANAIPRSSGSRPPRERA